MECRAWNEKIEKGTIAKKEYDGINSYLLYGKDSIDVLKHLGENMIFPKNHEFIKPGEYTKYSYIIIKGKVASFEGLRDGEERIYHIHEKKLPFP